MSPPPVWISPPVVTLPKGWCTQSTHLPHYGTVSAKRQPFRARLLSAWRGAARRGATRSGDARQGEARRGAVLGRFAATKRRAARYIASNDFEHRRSVFSTLFENRIGARWAAKKGGRGKGLEKSGGVVLLDSLAGTTPSHRAPLAFFALIKSSCLRAASSTAILARGTPPLLCFRIFLMISPLQTRILLSFSHRPSPLFAPPLHSPFSLSLSPSVSAFLAFFLFSYTPLQPSKLAPCSLEPSPEHPVPFSLFLSKFTASSRPVLDALPHLYRYARIHARHATLAGLRVRRVRICDSRKYTRESNCISVRSRGLRYNTNSCEQRNNDEARQLIGGPAASAPRVKERERESDGGLTSNRERNTHSGVSWRE